MDTIYAVCPECAHTEPRPVCSASDWLACEHCGEESPLAYGDREDALDASDGILGEARDNDLT